MNSGQAQVGRGPGPRVTAVNLIACVAVSIESLTLVFILRLTAVSSRLDSNKSFGVDSSQRFASAEAVRVDSRV